MYGYLSKICWGDNMNFSTATSSVIGLVMVVIVLVAGALVLSGMGDGFTAGSQEANITADGLSAVDNVSGNIGTVGTMIGVGLILMAVFGGLFVYFKGRD
jgi:hypothetical protein